MRRPRSLGGLVVVGGMALTGAAIVLALLVDLGTGPTSTAVLITGLHRDLLVVAVPLAILVEAVLIYAVWRFTNNDDPKPTPDDRRLELAWTVGTGLVLVFVGVTSYHVLAQPAVTAAADPGPDEDVLEVEVTGQQWHWSVTYPGADVTIQEADRIVLPADRPIRIAVTATDVIHSFHAPRLGLKQDAIPGQRHVLATRIADPGEYRLYCAEYCGDGHSRMRATIRVVEGPAFDSWVDSRGNESVDA